MLCHSDESERNANVSPVPLIALQLRVKGSKEPIPPEPPVERLHLVCLILTILLPEEDWKI